METTEINIIDEVSRELCAAIAAEVSDAKQDISDISKIIINDIPVTITTTKWYI
jgi:hypothetical protein